MNTITHTIKFGVEYNCNGYRIIRCEQCATNKTTDLHTRLCDDCWEVTAYAQQEIENKRSVIYRIALVILVYGTGVALSFGAYKFILYCLSLYS